jgi:hypothetical protein
MLDGYITLGEAAILAGVSPAELRRYANTRDKDGRPRLRTERIGDPRRTPHLTKPEWVRECMANRQRVRRNRPASPILSEEPGPTGTVVLRR